MFSRGTLKFWPLLLLFFLIAGAFSVPPTVRLFRNISTDPIDLLPPDQPNVQSLLKIRQKMETGTRIAIVLESDSPEGSLRYMTDLAARLRTQPFVGKITERKAGYDFFDKHKLLYLELEDLQTIRQRIQRRIEREKLKGLLLDLDDEAEFDFKDLETKYRGEYSDAGKSPYFTSADQRLITFYVGSRDPDPSIGAASRFYDQMTAFLKTENPASIQPDLKIYVAGASKVLEYRAIVRDLKRAGLISGLAIFLPLLLRFRNPITVLLIFAPLLLGLPIGFALSSLFIGKLSVITSFLFAILGGLGIENGIHIFSRYHECRAGGGTIEEALKEIFGPVARAILTSVASVAVTFLLLIGTIFRGFSDFGLIAGIGLWTILLLYLTFFPSLLILAEKVGLLKIKPAPLRERSKGWQFMKKRWVLVLPAVVTGVSLIASFGIGFEYDSRKIRADIPEIRIAKEKQRETMSRVNNPAVAIISSREEAEELKGHFRQKKEADRESPTIDTTRSYYDLVPPDQGDKMKVISEMREMLKDPTLKLVKGEQKKDLDRFKEALGQAEPFDESAIPAEVKEIFWGLFFINALPRLEMDNGRNAIAFSNDIGKAELPVGTFYPSSDAIIYGIVLKTMFRDLPRVLLFSLFSVSLFVFLDFRKKGPSGLVLLAILTGVLWLLGVMSLGGIRFNFYNMIILPAVMGMSIDNAIHVMHRYREEGPGSLSRVLSSTGLSCVLASTTNAAGFLGLLFTVHRGLFSMGLLAVLGVATCLLSTLVFLPSLLNSLEQRGQ